MVEPRDIDEPLWEMLEASTHGGSQADPALHPLIERMARSRPWRDVHERLMATDAVIGACLRDVPVPAGLAERLTSQLDGLALASRSRKTRRWLLAGGASLVVAASLLISIGIGVTRWRPHSGQGFVEAAVAHFVNEAPAAWSEDRPPAAYPISRDVRFRAMRWRMVDDFLGFSAVAYELPARAGDQQATLYVIRAEIADLPSRPPSGSMHNTGNCAAAAWQQGELVYVLVVTGGEDAFRRYLVPSASPIA